MKKNRLIIYILSLSTLLLAACHHTEEPEPVVETGVRSVLVYMVADNNLGQYGYDRADIREMLNASSDIPSDCRLLVYNSPYSGDVTLTEIKNGALDTLKTYDSSLTSIQSKRMLEVFEDFKKYAPAEQNGLILWSHATGWIQDGIADDLDTANPLSFGYVKGRTMNTSTLARTLEKADMWDWVYFDCCYMGSVETIYELRKATPRIVASVTELPSEGMPYHLNLKHFFAKGEADLLGAAKETFSFYDAREGQDRTCTMAVYDTSEMDALASAIKAIFEKADGSLPSDFLPQRYTLTSVSSCNYFDLAQYLGALCFADETERFAGANDAYADFSAALSATVLYEDATPYLWNSLPLLEHSGFSTYILRSQSDAGSKNYSTLQWYADVARYLNFD